MELGLAKSGDGLHRFAGIELLVEPDVLRIFDFLQPALEIVGGDGGLVFGVSEQR